MIHLNLLLIWPKSKWLTMTWLMATLHNVDMQIFYFYFVLGETLEIKTKLLPFTHNCQLHVHNSRLIGQAFRIEIPHQTNHHKFFAHLDN